MGSQALSDLQTETEELPCWGAPVPKLVTPVSPPEEPKCEDTIADNEQKMKEIQSELDKANQEWKKDCDLSLRGRRLQTSTAPAVDCDAKEAELQKLSQELSDLQTETEEL